MFGKDRRGLPRYVVSIAALACGYALSAQFGILIGADHHLVSAVWPPSGIAVAALVVGGRRYWPGVAAGAFAAEVIAGLDAPIAALIAIGATAGALLTATALERAHVRHELDRARDALMFFVLAGATMTLSATVGTSVLFVTANSSRPILETWTTWWIGDAMGVILITPVAMTLSRGCWRRGWALNAFFIVAGGAASWELWVHALPIRHLIIPLAIIAAMFLGPRGSAVVSLTISGAAIAATAWSHGGQSFVLLQTLNASVAMTSLTLVALVQERRLMHDELREFAEELEDRVAERTDELERANAHLRELDATKNAILSAVSHELRTPLTAILGFTELLRSPDVRTDADLTERLLERVDGSSRRLSRLLQDLLDLGRLEHGVIEPQREECDVRDLVETALLDLGLASHTLDIDVRGGPAFIDPTQFGRIVHNLVENAVKYTPGETRVRVTARVGKDQDVVLVVEDEGPGVPQDKHTAVFEPFIRLGNGRHAQGAGVGLALVARFARMHGGDAWLEDSPGGGAAFHVHLAVPGDRTDHSTTAA